MGDQPQKVLIVDDDVLIAEATARTVRGFGYQVMTAHDGPASVAAVRGDASISLVLMDVDLGRGMDGTEAARLILAERHLPVVFLTSHTEREMVEKVRHITRYGYVVKNSGNFVLQSSLEMAFELHEARQKAEERDEHIRSISNNLVNGMVYQVIRSGDGTRKFTYLSDSVRSMYGISPDEAMADPSLIYGRVHPDDLARVHAEEEAANRDMAVFRTETRMINHRGEIRWSYFVSNPRVQADGSTCWDGIELDITDRIKSQEALRKSREQYLAFFENSGTANAVFDEDLTLVFQNSRLAGLLRLLNNADCTGWPAWRIFGPELGPLIEERIRRVLESGKPDEFDTRFTVSGSFKWFHTVYQPLAYSDGRIFGVQTISLDITDSRLAEEALQESENRSRIITELTTDYIFIVDLIPGGGMKLRWASDNMKRETGRSAGDVPGPGEWIKVIHPDDRQRFAGFIESSARERQGGEFECRSFTAQGKDRWIRVFVRPASGDGPFPDAIIGAVKDITERKRSEIVLLESEERFRNIFEQGPLGICLGGSDFRYIRVNEKLCSMLGYTEEELMRITFREVTYRGDVSDDMNALVKLLQGEIPFYRTEKQYIRKDGSLIWCGVTVTIMRDIDGNFLYYIVMVENITERKRAEEKVMNLLREKDILLKEVHHRIKNNMTTIESILSLQSDSMSERDVHYALETARGRVQSMGVLYDRLFQSDTYRDTSVREYLHRLIHDVIRLYPGHESVTVEESIGDFFLDADTIFPLGIIVNELVTNVMKHALTGTGRVRLAVEAEKRGDSVTMVIRDSGGGIPQPEDRHQGFGLMLVERLARQLKGTFRMEQRNGTACIVEFPVPMGNPYRPPAGS